jgi:hypothetical protein
MQDMNQNISIANSMFENVAKLKYLCMTLTNQNYVYNEIKKRLNSGMVATIQFNFFCLMSPKNNKIILNYNFTSHFVSVSNLVSKTEARTQNVSENRVLRKIFDPKMKKVTTDWRK